MLKRISDGDPLGSTIAKIHLGIFSQCLRERLAPGSIARYYLRIAWLFRDRDTFYPDADLDAFVERLAKARGRWKRELPDHKDYPEPPNLVTTEVEALRLSRTYFERNYETLQKASQEDELRLR
ncbi:hypothetical protein ACFL6X_08845, partial [Candidatus Latescibacterota bacterium]